MTAIDYTKHDDDEHQYRLWMRKVDRVVIVLAGVSVFDLPDQPFRDWYADQFTAREAAIMALESDGYPVEFLQ